MTRKKRFPAPDALIADTLLRFERVSNTDSTSLADWQPRSDWQRRSESASRQAQEIWHASESLDQGMFCTWLEGEHVDVLAILRLIQLSEAQGRSGAAAAAADAKWRTENEKAFLEVLEAWQRNVTDPKPKSKITFCEEWSLELEKRGRSVTVETIYKSWLRNRSLPKGNAAKK